MSKTDTTKKRAMAATAPKAKTTAKPAAKKPAAKTAAKPAAKKTPAKAPAKKRGKVAGDTLTMAQLADFYVTELERAGKTAKTAQSYRADLRVAARFFGPETPVSALTPAKVKAYFDSDMVNKNRKGGNRNPITIAKVTRTLRLCLVHLATIGVLEKAPVPAAKAD